MFSDFPFVFRCDLLLLVQVLVYFAWFALCSQTPESLSNGLRLVLKCSGLFRAARSSFSKSVTSFERCVVVLSFSSGLPLRLKMSSLFRAVCSLILNEPQVPCCSPNLLSLSSGFLLVFELSSLFGAVCLSFRAVCSSF